MQLGERDMVAAVLTTGERVLECLARGFTLCSSECGHLLWLPAPPTQWHRPSWVIVLTGTDAFPHHPPPTFVPRITLLGIYRPTQSSDKPKKGDVEASGFQPCLRQKNGQQATCSFMRGLRRAAAASQGWHSH